MKAPENDSSDHRAYSVRKEFTATDQQELLHSPSSGWEVQAMDPNIEGQEEFRQKVKMLNPQTAW